MKLKDGSATGQTSRNNEAIDRSNLAGRARQRALARLAVLHPVDFERLQVEERTKLGVNIELKRRRASRKMP